MIKESKNMPLKKIKNKKGKKKFEKEASQVHTQNGGLQNKKAE